MNAYTRKLTVIFLALQLIPVPLRGELTVTAGGDPGVLTYQNGDNHPVDFSLTVKASAASTLDIGVGSVPVISNYELAAGQAGISVYLPAWSFALINQPAKKIVLSLDGPNGATATISEETFARSPIPEVPTPGFAGLPAPSTKGMFLQDYGKIAFPWFNTRQYAGRRGWKVDSEVRDAGPFVLQSNYGTHPSVRIHYSPQVYRWLRREEQGNKNAPLPNGSMIVKEMFVPPSSIYREIAQNEYFVTHPKKHEELLTRLMAGWAIMIKDTGGNSKDGWFWMGPGVQQSGSYQSWMGGNLSLPYNTYPAQFPDQPYNPNDPQLLIPRPYYPKAPHLLYSGFGLGTCIRCHASSKRENTFSSLKNIDGEGLIFRVDNSWRSKDDYLDAQGVKVYTTVLTFMEEQKDAAKTAAEKAKIQSATLALLSKFDLPPSQRPPVSGETPDPLQEHRTFRDELAEQEEQLNQKTDSRSNPGANEEPPPVNADFVKSFKALTNLSYEPSNKEAANFSFPAAFADHVIPGLSIAKGGRNNPHTYLTSDNCYGCHGGLGSPPFGLSMFVRAGGGADTGYNLSEFGEWRWSPMGLAGRDPIFHSQLESELILLHEEQVDDSKQQALIDTCLRCHGAMGLRQLGIDHPHRSQNAEAKEPFPGFNPNRKNPILNPGFNPNLFYITERNAKDQSELHEFGKEALPKGIASQTPEELAKFHKYGDLAREGISCTVCHRVSPPNAENAMKWVKDVREYFNGDKTKYPPTDPPQKGKPWIGSEDDVVWTDTFFYFLANNNTGLYERNEANELYGPFEDVITGPMVNALGIIPKAAPVVHPPISNLPASHSHQTFTATSEMCGTCHTINLPNVGAKQDEYPILTALEPNGRFQSLPHSIEQATYLEWLNSDFGPGAENKPGPEFQSCQDCHMPNSFKMFGKNEDGAIATNPDGSVNWSINIDPLVSQIASIQDSEYPQAEHSLSARQLDVKHRSDYQRHEHVGLNAFMIEMVKQFPGVLGVDASDYETGSATGPDLAIANMQVSALENRVATIKIGTVNMDEEELTIPVRVTNRTGHRFPSGVAFRRAFVELLVKNAAGGVIWSSGRTDRAGVILDKAGRRLKTEFLNERPPDQTTALYQPNHQEITRSDQVQIYEELTTKADYQFTNSFIHRVHHIKDNRLLPRGWVSAATFAGRGQHAKVKDQGNLLFEMMTATEAEGASVTGGEDPNGVSFPPDEDFRREPSTGSDRFRYVIKLKNMKGDGRGQFTPHSVEATIYSQALMPSWFYERFSLANSAKGMGYQTPETDRLYFIASHLNLDGTAIENWKLKISSDTTLLRE